MKEKRKREGARTGWKAEMRLRVKPRLRLSKKRGFGSEGKEKRINPSYLLQGRRKLWLRKRDVLDSIRGNGYIEASELCPQFQKNLIACFF